MNKQEICMFVTLDKLNGIGIFNENTHEFLYPWNIREEQDYFFNIISHIKYPNTINVIITGRRTWEMYKERFLDSSKYLYIIVSNTLQQKLDSNLIQLGKNTIIHKSLIDSINYCKSLQNVNKIIIAGGKDLYTTAINTLKIDIIYMIKIMEDYKCNIYLPVTDIDKKYILSYHKKIETVDMNNKNNINLIYCKYDNKYVPRKIQSYKIHEEYQYIHTIEQLIDKQTFTTYSNKLRFKSVIGTQYIFSLDKSFPLFTTTKIELIDVYNDVLKLINDDNFFVELSNCIYDLKSLFFEKHITINYKIGNIENICFYIEQVENTVLLSSMLTIDVINVLEIPMEIARYGFLIYLVHSLLNDSDVQIQLDKLVVSFGKINANIDDKELLQSIIKKTPYHFPKLEFLIRTSTMLTIPYDALRLINYKFHT